jgi:hypothetical protein
MSALTIDPLRQPPKAKKPKAKRPVADSWEDEAVSSSEDDDEDATPTDPAHPDSVLAGGSSSAKGTSAPPPTPISPTYNNKGPGNAIMDAFGSHHDHFADPSASSSSSSAPRRPEKTDAVARRMIAGALGIKAPKATEEQKAYDRAVREQERKRRDEEKAAERKRLEEAEKAKAAIWED